MTSPTVADHLARRLHAAGVRHLFGVPGDFTLALNDALSATGLLTWVGTASELGAGYAADGYARRHGLAALVTTYGVGELSCIGAIAGAYAEHVPVLQITGSPATGAAAAGSLLHHTLGDGDFDHFARAYREVTVASATLTRDGAAAEIDRVLTAVRTSLRPGYLSVPADLVGLAVDAPPVEVPDLAADRGTGSAPSAPAAVQAFADAARRLLASVPASPADAPHLPGAVVVGHLVQRLGAEPAVRGLAEAGGLPTVALVSAKGTVDEDHPLYRGVYLAALGDAGARAVVETAPVLITVGALWSDVVSGAFTHRADPARTIALDLHSATVGGRTIDGVHLVDALAALTAVLAESAPREPVVAVTPVARDQHGDDARDHAGDEAGDDGGPLTQAALWAAVEDWLTPGCTLVTDIGTSFWGAVGLRLPPDTVFVSQPMWSAIGYALPATLGAALAEPGRRPVLITGEGAAMMTAGELGTLAARVPGAVVIVIDNAGYTIERVLRSPQAAHHDVVRWDWAALAAAVAPDADPLTLRATTSGELLAALAAAGEAKDRLTLIQAVTGPLDVPPLLQALATAVRR